MTSMFGRSHAAAVLIAGLIGLCTGTAGCGAADKKAATGTSRANSRDVARLVRRENSAVRKCYAAATKEHPGLQATVNVTYTVGTQGAITSVRVTGAEGAFAHCVSDTFARIQGLPILAEPTSFNQSYVFSSGPRP